MGQLFDPCQQLTEKTKSAKDSAAGTVSQKKDQTVKIAKEKKEQITRIANDTVNDMKEGAAEIRKEGSKSIFSIADFFIESFRDTPDKRGH